MSIKIMNIKDINLSKVIMPEHPCMPNIFTVPQETFVAIDIHKLRAMCSLWTQHTPTYAPYKTGVIGNFFADDHKAGLSLLDYAAKRLKEQGFGYVVGPMNGNTWHSYRLVTDADDSPPFFLEYYTPHTWPAIFSSAGFEQIAHYSSARSNELDYEDTAAKKFEARKDALGLTIRPFDVAHVKDELRAIHALCLQSFSRNFLYTDISQPDFLALYETIIPYVNPDFFLLAEHGGNLVGFIFAVPDFLQKERGETIDTLIIKTVAKTPGRAYAGLGTYLVHAIHQKAVKMGFKSVIHALMHDNNASKAISHKSAQTMRKYTLYGKRLYQ